MLSICRQGEVRTLNPIGYSDIGDILKIFVLGTFSEGVNIS